MESNHRDGPAGLKNASMYLNYSEWQWYNIVIGDMILSEIQDSSSDVFKLITDFGIETSYKIE